MLAKHEHQDSIVQSDESGFQQFGSVKVPGRGRAPCQGIALLSPACGVEQNPQEQEMRQVDLGQSPQAFRRRRYCTARLIVMAGSILALGGISLAPAGSLAAPTAISEILELADVEIGCPDGGSECSPVECAVMNPTLYVVEGRARSASGRFAASYASQGFNLNDGTGGLFIATPKDSDLEVQRGDRLRVTGTSGCVWGTLSLTDVIVEEAPDKGPVVFAPRQVGQLAHAPSIDGGPEVTPNWCDCLNPFSATEGEVITVRGTAVADLADDGEYGFKLFLDDGTGVAQIFIDAKSGVRVKKIRDSLLTQGEDLCVTGVVGQFAGVGFELLPRTTRDIRRARPKRRNPCRH
jgi:hypothetical protein